jgi:hypothetical protein
MCVTCRQNCQKTLPTHEFAIGSDKCVARVYSPLGASGGLVYSVAFPDVS